MNANILLLISCLSILMRADCVVVTPSNSYVATGSNTTLSCSASDGQRVQWLKGPLGYVVPLNNTSHMSTVTEHQLTIRNFHGATHVGHYSCLVEGPLGHRQLSCPSTVHHARIMAYGESQDTTTYVYADMNSTIVFHCDPPHSWPVPQIQWTKDGVEISTTDDPRLYILPSGNLYIINVTSVDVGMYKCSAHNRITSVTRHSHVTHQLILNDGGINVTKPFFTLAPDNAVVAVLGESVDIECSGQGYPQPVLEWLKHDNHFPHETTVLQTGTLRFDPVIADDAGLYECILSNDVGSVSVRVTVTVAETPQLTSPPESHTVISTSNSQLSCSATGSAPLHLLLYHDGMIVDKVDGETTQNQLNLTHYISEGGIYQCFASNNYGCVQWSTTVTRNLSESLLTTSQYISTTTDMLTTSPEQTTNFPTNTPSTTATFELVNITEPVQMSTTAGIQSPTTSSVPPLVVSTNGDLFDVREGEVVSLQCRVVGGGDGVTVQWSYNDEPLKEVRVQTGEDEHGNTQLFSQLTYEPITNDHEGRYICDSYSPMLGYHAVATIDVIVRTGFVLTERPQNLSIRVHANGNVFVTWTAHPQFEGHISGYKLALDKLAKAGAKIVAPSVTEYMINGLVDTSISNTISVWAYNLEGDGPCAEVVYPSPNSHDVETRTTTSSPATEVTPTVATTESSPVCVVSRINSTHLSINWLTHESIEELTATCTLSQTTSRLPVSMGTTSVVVGYLLPSCPYVFQVGGSQCTHTTPHAKVEIDAVVGRSPNGSVHIDWTIPKELASSKHEVIVEVKVQGTNHWIRVLPRKHISANISNSDATLAVRLRVNGWVGQNDVVIPSIKPDEDQTQTTNNTTPSPPKTTAVFPTPAAAQSEWSEVVLMYATIFLVLLTACTSIVVVILILKYVQMKRRESDKVTNHREKHLEEFHKHSSLRHSSIDKQHNNIHDKPKK